MRHCETQEHRRQRHLLVSSSLDDIPFSKLRKATYAMAPRRKKQKRNNFGDISNAVALPNNRDTTNSDLEDTLSTPRGFIDALPDELLSDVFRKAVVSNVPSTHEQPRVPLSHQCGFILSRVSSRWRRIALAETALWLRFRMKLDQGGNLKRATKALQTILARAGNRDISIAIDGAHEDTPITSANFTALVELLFDCINRLKTVDIHLPGECHVRHLLNRLTGIGTPILARLAVSYRFNHSVNHLHGCDCSALDDKERIMIDMTNAPVLEHLAVSGFCFRLVQSRVAFRNLTAFHWRTRGSMSIQRIVGILSAAPLLQDLRVYCLDAGNAATQTVPQQRIYHEGLKAAYLGYRDISHLAMFFRAVEAPSLESLSLRRTHHFPLEPPAGWVHNTLFIGYTTVPMLKTLVIADSCIIRGRLVEIIQEQRCLERLSLQPYKRNDELIKTLSLMGANRREHIFCPTLETLDLIFEWDCTLPSDEEKRNATIHHHEQVIEMVLSRFQLRRGTKSKSARMKEVCWKQYLDTIVIKDRINPHLRSRLDAAQNKGLKYTVCPPGFGPSWWT
jgi:hypothetical protein